MSVVKESAAESATVQVLQRDKRASRIDDACHSFFIPFPALFKCQKAFGVRADYIVVIR